MKKLVIVGEDTVISGDAIIGMRAVETNCLNVWLSDGSVVGIVTNVMKAEDVLKELIQFFIHGDDSVAYAIENSRLWDEDDEKEDGICI